MCGEYMPHRGDIARSAMFCNTVTELVAGDHTVLSHYMIEREHEQAFNISTLRLQQGTAPMSCVALSCY